jgi:hypothetical protein
MSNKVPTLLELGALYINGLPSNKIPIEYITDWVTKRMPEYGYKNAKISDRVLVLVSETGSGKSTVLPVSLFRILRSKDTPGRIRYTSSTVICTQPRVLTAIALASAVSNYNSPWNPDMIRGKTVGFQTGVVSEKPEGGLIYATTGVLSVQLQQMSDQEIMDSYKFIIIDEAHERSLASDMMMMLIKNFYIRNVDNVKLPFLILMSATIETKKYLNYFSLGSDNSIDVKGRTYHIQTKWPDHGTNDYILDSAKKAISIHEENFSDNPNQADILIFVPGYGEGVSIAQLLIKANIKYVRSDDEKLKPMLVLLVNRDVVASQTGHYPLVFEKPEKLPLVGGKKPFRRVIISTVVAETGLTIDTLKYVIDCGWSRIKEIYQPFGIKSLITKPAPKSRIKQRKGRVGRLFPGVFFPMYTESVYNSLDEWQMPDMINIGIDEIFLSLIREQQKQKIALKQISEFRIEDLSLIDTPPVNSIIYSNYLATNLGFISSSTILPTTWPPTYHQMKQDETLKGYGLTELGYLASKFTRISMESARIIFSGIAWNVAMSDLLTIVSVMGTNLKDLYISDKDQPDFIAGLRALKMASPMFLAKKIGSGLAETLPATENDISYLKIKILLSDEFIEMILIYDLFAKTVLYSNSDPLAVYNWCEDLGLNYDTLILLTKRRTHIIEDLVSNGINPFRNEENRISQSDVNSFVKKIIAIKLCLLDGLRHNLILYQDDHYETRQGIKVDTPQFLSDAIIIKLTNLGLSAGTEYLKPKIILTDSIRISPNLKGSSESQIQYSAKVGLYSILDGYITPDIQFSDPRTL